MVRRLICLAWAAALGWTTGCTTKRVPEDDPIPAGWEEVGELRVSELAFGSFLKTARGMEFVEDTRAFPDQPSSKSGAFGVSFKYQQRKGPRHVKRLTVTLYHPNLELGRDAYRRMTQIVQAKTLVEKEGRVTVTWDYSEKYRGDCHLVIHIEGEEYRTFPFRVYEVAKVE